ncbi:hypothetical protein CAEBREN_23921 [Caenorhabditis brenneri]|uniref:Neurotransmitter-gated ion-channel ligand-binding domain-containing protein n=1 Tax=Caenorhabditis brenneri TaxID=135651 RepID=G0MU15_CAEBE|nr:hypothetical protein CAEBREN_23921 [Caenorhabditis brenneri]
MLKLYPVLILFWLLNDVTSQKMTQEEYSSPYIDQNNTVHPPMTELKLTMTMMKLVDVVEVEEKVTFLFDYLAQYFDQRLAWDPMEYGGITHFYVPQSKVWLPEITIADAHEVKFFESDDAPRIAWVHSNGSVGFYTSTVSSVICQLDITVGLTNIMAMTFILVILAADLPKTARIPLLAIYVIVGLIIVMISIAVAIALPFIRKYQKRRSKSQEKPEEPSRFGKFYNWLRIEYILMFIFQTANLVNFIILFV